jgi:hypothetical protein
MRHLQSQIRDLVLVMASCTLSEPGSIFLRLGMAILKMTVK